MGLEEGRVLSLLERRRERVSLRERGGGWIGVLWEREGRRRRSDGSDMSGGLRGGVAGYVAAGVGGGWLCWARGQ